MKYTIVLLSLFCVSLVAQDKEVIDLVTTEDGWRAESFRFPKPFAPDVNFDGVADVRFTKGWGDKDSPQFWSYTFTWKILLEKPLTVSELEDTMQRYFDGLMNAVNRDTTITVPETMALFTSDSDTSGQLNYKAKIRLYDAFFTQEVITLNVTGHSELCEQSGLSIYMFRLSPQVIGTPTWEYILRTKLRDDVCDLN